MISKTHNSQYKIIDVYDLSMLIGDEKNENV